MPKLTPPAFLLHILLITNHAISQKLTTRDYSFTYRVFEMNSAGNNPTTISPFLKNPSAYQDFLKTVNYNSLYGNPGVQQLHTFYLTVEWKVDSAVTQFWKKHTLQAGLQFTGRISQEAGALAYESWYSSTDPVLHNYNYSLTKNQQFLGAHMGINRRLNLSKRLKLFYGLHAQGSFAIAHFYQQRWDSGTFVPGRGWETRTTHLPHLKGKNFFQWQVMVPVGLEFFIYQKEFLLRFEVDAGIVGSRYRFKTPASKEAHGAGLSMIYRPKRGK